MVGIDIVLVSRIEKLVQKYGENFLKKFLNDSEIALCRGQNQSEKNKINNIDDGEIRENIDSSEIHEISKIREIVECGENQSEICENSEIGELQSGAKNPQSDFNFQRIAGFFATKEALSKALGCGIGKDLRFSDIEISKNNLGAPCVKLKKEVKKHFKIENISLSISHDGGFAIAVVVTQKQDSDAYLLFLESKVSKENLFMLKNKLKSANRVDLSELVFLDLKSPNLAMIFSICLGIIGVDRFYQGRIGLGIAKLCLSWFIIPWVVIDWFLIRDSIKKDNLERILEFLDSTN